MLLQTKPQCGAVPLIWIDSAVVILKVLPIWFKITEIELKSEPRDKEQLGFLHGAQKYVKLVSSFLWDL